MGNLSSEDLLFRSELFYGLDGSALHSILQMATRHVCPAGGFLAHQGEPATQLSFVVSGLAKLCDTTSEGDQLILGWLKEEEFADSVLCFGIPPPTC